MNEPMTDKETTCIERIQALKDEPQGDPWQQKQRQGKLKRLVATLSGLYHKDHYAHTNH